MPRRRSLVGLFAALFAPVALAADVTVAPATGDPGIKRIDTIALAPGGHLLIADGATSRVVVIKTGDTANRLTPDASPKVANVVHEIAGRLGSADKDVEIAEMVVNPDTGRSYLLVKKLDEKRNLIVTVDPDGTIAPLDLAKASFVAVKLPQGAAPANAPRVTEMAWAKDRLVCSARTGEEFASKLMVIPAPLGPDSAANTISAETYHVAHGKWETKAPMAALCPYEENGRLYVVGGFGCTPIVKYPVDTIKDGAKVKGESMIELGSGNRPLDMFIYTKHGKPSVLVSTFRFHHDRAPMGPSAYWVCRFDQSILGSAQTNEKAMRRNVKKPDDSAANVAIAFSGVRHMCKLDDGRAIVIRENKDDKAKLDLEVLPLP